MYNWDMHPEVLQKLRTINKEFYQRFGEAFAETRRRIQPGVARVLERYIHDGDWLDIGCGSGALSQAWIKHGLKGSYTGIDFSQPLLREAERSLAEHVSEPEARFSFKRIDLMEENWWGDFPPGSFDGVLAFAVLHHVPGAGVREGLLQQIAELIQPGGCFIHSEWQFQHSPKLVARIQPWSLVGLSQEDVEEGDTLLDWRHQVSGREDEPGLRYVHLFSRTELSQLAETCGFGIVDEFESDGAGEKLGLYQVWRKND